ncbi:hypothetical protein RRF57_000177 [Xylaria bambusicola]|uniref:Uncharacterized protein n=1 Tax=Xylaria bambusicola TaxID=326684 RepID=A0AAN7UCF6_9PEZI
MALSRMTLPALGRAVYTTASETSKQGLSEGPPTSAPCPRSRPFRGTSVGERWDTWYVSSTSENVEGPPTAIESSYSLGTLLDIRYDARAEDLASLPQPRPGSVYTTVVSSSEGLEH